jgi:hypothetical protein
LQRLPGRFVLGAISFTNSTYCSTIGAYVKGIMDFFLWYHWCMPRTGRPKEERTYSNMLRVRVAAEHDAMIREAADVAAQRKGSGDLSSWVRETLVAAARKELKKRDGDAEG